MSVLLRARGLTRVYPGVPPVRALHDMDLDIHAQEMIALMGPSGSGKTTLLGLVGLLDRQTSGTLTFGDTKTDALTDRQRTRLRADVFGFVFQRFFLIEHLTAVQNVEVALAHRGLSASARRERASRALDRVGLSSRLNHRPSTLSGGEQQRVAVARAVVGSPSLVIADEPTGNLDHTSATGVMEVIADFVRSGGAAVIATHDPEIASRCSRNIQMRDGGLRPP